MLDIILLLVSQIVALLHVVHRVLLPIRLAEGKVETNASNHSDDSDGAVVPDEQRVLGERDKGLAERG